MKKMYWVFITVAMLAAIPSAFAIIGRFGGSQSTTDPEKAFIVVKNNDQTAWSRGTAVTLDVSATGDDGVSGHINLGPVGTAHVLCITDEAVAINALGRCQVYGYHDGVLVNGLAAAAPAGGFLTAAASTAAGHLRGSPPAPSQLVAIALDAVTTSTTVKAFIQLQ